MKGLLLRLSGLDADAENAVRVIGFFDRLITECAGLDALVRSTSELAGVRWVCTPPARICRCVRTRVPVSPWLITCP